MPIVLIDEVYAEVTSDPDHHAKDRDVKASLDDPRCMESSPKSAYPTRAADPGYTAGWVVSGTATKHDGRKATNRPREQTDDRTRAQL